MSQIVTGVIFRQPFIELQNIAGTIDNFESGDPASRHAIFNHFDTAGIGGDIAANLTRSR